MVSHSSLNPTQVQEYTQGIVDLPNFTLPAPSVASGSRQSSASAPRSRKHRSSIGKAPSIKSKSSRTSTVRQRELDIVRQKSEPWAHIVMFARDLHAALLFLMPNQALAKNTKTYAEEHLLEVVSAYRRLQEQTVPEQRVELDDCECLLPYIWNPSLISSRTAYTETSPELVALVSLSLVRLQEY